MKVLDYDHVLSMTKGHIALGGGGLALFGSGCLYSWPEKLSVRFFVLKNSSKNELRIFSIRE